MDTSCVPVQEKGGRPSEPLERHNFCLEMKEEEPELGHRNSLSSSVKLPRCLECTTAVKPLSSLFRGNSSDSEGASSRSSSGGRPSGWNVDIILRHRETEPGTGFSTVLLSVRLRGFFSVKLKRINT